MEVGGRLLLALAQQQQTAEFLRLRLSEDMFYGSEVPVFRYVAKHVEKHRQLPHPETLREEFPNLGSAPEPPLFYFEQVEQRFTHKHLNKALIECNALMKEQDTQGAVALLDGLLADVHGREQLRSVVDFATTGSDMVTDEIKRIKLAKEDPALSLGWPTFDKMSGGVRGGDVVSIIGRPAMGKTWFVLFIAHFLWWVKQKTVLVVSMEMDLLSIAQRLTGIASSIETKYLRTAELTTVQLTRLARKIKALKKQEVGHLWLMDGGLHSQVEEVYAAVEQVKPDAVLIDGAYLLGHPDSRMDKYKRVDANIELIKKHASRAGVPAILSYQFNRQAVKKWKGKGESAGLEDIAYTDAIGQISSAVLAMKQEDSVETANQRMIDVLKCRTGQVGKFNVNWDFNTMDFSEVKPEKPGEMQFV